MNLRHTPMIASEDNRYRYWLRRVLRPQLDADEERWCVFAMLNPSTADETTNDPTVRRCMSFAAREGCTHLGVVNVFPYRATRPDELLVLHEFRAVENARVSREAVALGDVLVAAWGAHAARITTRNPRAARAAVEAIAQQACKPLYCLGRTAGGYPKHPLYVPGDQPLVWFGGARKDECR
jgi:hypothetical protein